MNIEAFRVIIKEKLSPERFYHSCCVSEEAEVLAKKYGADPDKARFIGLLHDITKEEKKDVQLQTVKKYSIILDKVEASTPKLWHAITGAAVLKNEYGIGDEELINAVRYHTTARPSMSLMEKIIYLADFISKDRDFEGVEALRSKVHKSIDGGMRAALDFSINEVLSKGAPIHINTINARNEMICIGKKTLFD